MPMRRSGSADLPAGAKLPATHAEAARGHKHHKRQRGFGVWDYYNRKLATAPVVTKGLTCFFGEGINARMLLNHFGAAVKYFKHQT